MVHGAESMEERGEGMGTLNCEFRIAGVGLRVSLEARTKNKAETDYEKLKKSGF